MATAFGQALRVVREADGVSLATLARRARFSESHLRSIENGNRACTTDAAEACDAALGTGGLLVELMAAERDGDEMKRRTVLRALGVLTVGVDPAPSAHSRIAQALDVAVSNSANSVDVAADSIGELVAHFSCSVATSPPAGIYEELLSVRSYAASFLRRSTRLPRRPDLLLGAGWLSNLLAIATSYMGDHASALVWCSDAERRGRELGHPEMAGWAALTRAMIAYYQGQADRSVTIAAQGRSETMLGTVVHAKLAAQEMRALAMLGDTIGMTNAKRRASRAIGSIPDTATNTGVFSIALSDDPPYTATSLLLVKRYAEAVSVTTRVIETAYAGGLRGQGIHSSNYARTLLILALAHAGLGHADQAVVAGHAALDSAELVWPTLVLARKLDGVLTRDFAKASAIVGYSARCRDAAGHHEQPSGSPTARR